MKIIDVHTHIYPRKIAEKAIRSISDFYNLPMEENHGTAEHLLKSAREASVDKIFICSVATTPKQVPKINDFLLEKSKQYEKLLPLITLHPAMEQVEIKNELKRLSGQKLFGIKLHPDFQKFDFCGLDGYKLFDCLDGSLPVLVHAGDSRYNFSHPYKLMTISRSFPHVKIIAAHFGGYSEWEQVEGYANCPNVYFDTSSTLKFLSRETAVHLIKTLGAHRFMFGSDFPMWNYQKELQRVFDLNLPKSDLNSILCKNAESLFKLH